MNGLVSGFRLIVLIGVTFLGLYLLVLFKNPESRVCLLNIFGLVKSVSVVSLSFLISLFILISHGFSNVQSKFLKQGNKIELKRKSENIS